MSVLHFTIFLAFVKGAFCIICSYMSNGTYGQGCRAYVRCENHVATLISCQYNKVFNSRTGQCDDPKNVPPPCGVIIDCSTKQDGKYPDYFDNCTTYYACRGGAFFGHNFCTPGTVFNEELQTCDWPSDVKRPCGTKL